MRIFRRTLCVIVTIVLTSPLDAHARPLEPEAIEAALWDAARWQMEHPEKFLPVNWEMSPLYDGLLNAGRATGEPAYVGEVLGFGRAHGWSLGPSFYFADDHAVGHAWLDLFLADPEQEQRLAPTKGRFDAILADPEERALEIGKPGPATDRWTWCDALYMGPPTWARLFTATGDRRYLEFMDQEWKYTYDMLWDDEESLFFRDSRFIPRRGRNGEKIFWSRGNGWVFGGLALTIPHLPEDHPTRPFYIRVFRAMARSIANAQQPSGLWHPSLLDPADPDIGEASGSGFFVFGFAWGVNSGLLDADTYQPVIEKGWTGLLTRQHEDGQVGYVQQVGDRPVNTVPRDHHTYGTGAFLLAGSEILKGLRPGRAVSLRDLLPEAERYVDAFWDIKRLPGLRVVSASGDDGNRPINAFDGISDTDGNRWSVNGLGTPHFVEVDLGEDLELEGFVVHPYQDRDYQYRIEAGPSPDRLVTVVDRSSNTRRGPIRDDLEKPVSARIVRITVTGAATYDGPWVSLKEVELLTPARDLAPPPPPPGMRSLRPASTRPRTMLQQNGGWCWFQDERAIIDGDLLIFGSVAGENRADSGNDGGWAGDLRVTGFDLKSGARSVFTLKGGYNCDDHAAPAIHRLADGRYLASYMGHSIDRSIRWRITENPGDIGSWGPERTHDTASPVCYANLHEVREEGTNRIYNFFRGEGWDPNFIASDDSGNTWDISGRLLDWPDRPYIKYASNRGDTVHFIATDGHPRVFDNSVYHGFIRNGFVHDASGRVVDRLDAQGLRDKSLTRIFEGNPHSVAWTVDLELDGRGYPVAALSVQKDGAAIRNDPGEAVALDHRYVYARFDGEGWISHEMAYAGTGLYAREPDYTGLVAIDPNEPEVVYVSSDVHPGTGLPNISRADNRRHYEIFRGRTSDGGRSWSWTAITQDSTTDNLRPVVPRSDRYRAVLWMRGDYRTYTDYGTDIVGLIETR